MLAWSILMHKRVMLARMRLPGGGNKRPRRVSNAYIYISARAQSARTHICWGAIYFGMPRYIVHHTQQTQECRFAGADWYVCSGEPFAYSTCICTTHKSCARIVDLSEIRIKYSSVRLPRPKKRHTKKGISTSFVDHIRVYFHLLLSDH